MELKQSKTQTNLARAFAGECQAGARYQFLASKAKQDTYCYLESVIKKLAKNEMAHAKEFYEHLTEDNKGKCQSVAIDGAYPFCCGSLLEELEYSAHNELEENKTIYPSFAKVAREEGFVEVARKFELIAEVEKCHNMLLTEVIDFIKKNQLYKRTTAVKWKCSNCGHEATGKEAWKICPLCSEAQGEVIFPLGDN